jgi:exportin-7
MLTYVFVGLAKSRQDDTVASLSQLMNSCVAVFNQMLSHTLNVVMFEDCKNLWSMSRPLLALILLQPEYFREAQGRIVAVIPSHKQQQVVDAFTELMEGIDNTLSSRNRDRFTQNLAAFRRDVNYFTKSIHSPNEV